jgi:hypothetical protein
MVASDAIKAAKFAASKLGFLVGTIHNHPNNEMFPSQDDYVTYVFDKLKYNFITDQNGNVAGPY